MAQVERAATPAAARNFKATVLAGLAGGVVFGLMMQMMGMMPMVAMLVGSQSAGVGWIVHLSISAIIGALFAFMPGLDKNPVGAGLAYGFIWWILGPLTIMPVWLGMGLMWSAAGIQGAIPSLFGHLAFGLVAGLVYPRAKTL